MRPRRLPPVVRGALAFSAPLNALGAALFSPWGGPARSMLGLPEGPLLYSTTVSLWVLAFGVAYAWSASTGRLDPVLLALGAWGKLTFVCLMTWSAVRGDIPVVAAIAAAPDLVLAVLFLAALRPPRASDRPDAGSPVPPS